MASGEADTLASSWRRSGRSLRASGTSCRPSSKLPDCSSVWNVPAGRRLTPAVAVARLVPALAVRRNVPAPSASRARNRKRTTASRPRAIGVTSCGAPTISNCSDASSRVVTSTAASASATPSRLLTTPAVSSNSSPGATDNGAFGWITKSPRDTSCELATPMPSALTATATSRIEPLNESGTT